MPEPTLPGTFLFASESVTEGCPDKLCDRVADAVVDACLSQDAEARVSCEVCTKSGMVMLLGEVAIKASVNYEQVIREAVKAVGYDNDDKGLDWRTMNVIVAVEELSPDLAQAVAVGRAADDGGGGQGVVFGYATDETPEMMPLSHVLATRLCAQLDKVRKDGTLSWARPDGRAQVIMEYREEADGSVSPTRVHTVAISAQHAPGAKFEQVERDIREHVIKPVLPERLCDSNTLYRVTPPKRSVLGALSDAGMTGRRIVADTYGGWGSHAGGSLSGKDGSKVVRSATYAARWAAVSLVAANLCKRACVQLSYCSGSAEPSSISVNSYGTSKQFGKTDAELTEVLRRSFDFRASALQGDLALKAPNFQRLAAHGHLGRTELELAWEKPKELK